MTAVETLSLFDQVSEVGGGAASPVGADAPPAADLPLDAPVRLSDPDTAVAAARALDGANDRALVLEALTAMGGRGSADDITDLLNDHGDRAWQRNCVSSRCSQLVRRGRITDSGERGTGATGRPVIVFEVVG